MRILQETNPQPQETLQKMKPKSTGESQGNLFSSRLDQILNMQHRLVLLSHQIDWATLDEQLSEFYADDFGRPGLSTRLMVGL